MTLLELLAAAAGTGIIPPYLGLVQFDLFDLDVTLWGLGRGALPFGHRELAHFVVSRIVGMAERAAWTSSTNTPLPSMSAFAWNPKGSIGTLTRGQADASISRITLTDSPFGSALHLSLLSQH